MANSIRTSRGNRIFKKQSSSKGWTFMKQVNGRRYYFPLGRVISDAKTLADQIDAYALLNPIKDVVKKFRPNGLRVGDTRLQHATVGDIAKRYEALAPSECGVEPSTIKTYLSVFRKIVREATGRDPEKFYISDFTPALLSEFKRKRLEGVDCHDKRISVKRTINSSISQVQGVFSKKALKLYRDFDVSAVVETLADFSPYEKVGVKYRLPSKELVIRTHELLDSYDSPEQFVPLALALHFGLRRQEIIHSKRSWFQEHRDGYRIAVFTEDSFRVKAGEDGYAFGSSVIAEKILNMSDSFDYLIPLRNSRSRLKGLVRDLRSIGWDRRLPLHECRKLYGSFWASKENLFFAQKTLRHASPLTTNDYYADLIDEEGLLDLWSA